ncbi:MAG: cupin domain-containing protein [Actinomycetota bacterium]
MKASKAALTEEMKSEGIETRGDDWGELRVRHIELPAGVDFTPLFEGLPGDLCQCPHWGHVLEGSITLRYADGSQEVTRAGELYYWPGGHTGWTDEGVSFIEISPAAQVREVMEHLATKMAATGD